MDGSLQVVLEHNAQSMWVWAHGHCESVPDLLVKEQRGLEAYTYTYTYTYVFRP